MVMVVGAKALGAGLGEDTTGADLGGSSLYSWQYHFQTFVHELSFQDHSTLSQTFQAGFVIRSIHQRPSAEVTSVLFHIHLQPFQDT